jgi:hypothetical protein
VVLSHAEILSARLRTRDEIFFCWLRDFAAAGFLGSTGRWPVGLGSLPRLGTGTPLTPLLKEFSGTVAKQPQSGSLRPQNARVPR